jgi:hypothetical protein
LVASSTVLGIGLVTLFVLILGMMSPTYSSAQTIVSVSKEFQTPDIVLDEPTVKGDENEQGTEEQGPTVKDGNESEVGKEEEPTLKGEEEQVTQQNETESEEQPRATKPRKEVEGGLNLDTPGIQAPYKVKVTFDSITVYHNHESVVQGKGEWKLAAYVQGKKIDLTEASCTHGTITTTLPNGQHLTIDKCKVTGLNDVSDHETIKFPPGTEVTVDIPFPLPLSIFVYGQEVDCDNPPFLDDASEKVISILKGLDTRKKMLENIQNYIAYSENADYDFNCFNNISENEWLGQINKIYEPTGYGAGAHPVDSDVSNLGILTYPGGTQVPASDIDYTLTYTISITAPPPSSSSPPTIKPETSSGTCNNNLPVSGVTSSGSQSTFPPTNAIDNKLNTKWWSTFIVKPFITLDTGGFRRAVCSVDIAWADGSSHPYLFDVSVSTDGTTFTNVLSGTSTGTTTSPEKYTFPQTQARYVKITITERGRLCKQHSANI